MELDREEHKQIWKKCPHKEMERSKCENNESLNVKIMKAFMAVVFSMELIRKIEFTDYWSTRQSMKIPWFCMMFSCDHFRKILRAYNSSKG